MLIIALKNATQIGNPTLVEGVNGGQAISLNGSGQYLIINHINKCLLNPNLCPFGITFSFNLKIKNIKISNFIISTGTDGKDGCGFNVWYTKRRLYTRLQTRSREWVAFTPMTKANQFFHVRISWSKQFGMSLYIDRKLKISTQSYTWLKKTSETCSSLLFVGNNIKKTDSAQIIIGGWSLINAHIKIILSLGLSIGKIILLMFLY